MSYKDYKSPPHKLIKFFKESRDSWEETAKERREQLRDLNARIRDLEASRESWKAKAKEAEKRATEKGDALKSMQEALDKAQADQSQLLIECEELKKNSRISRTPQRLYLRHVDHQHCASTLFWHQWVGL